MRCSYPHLARPLVVVGSLLVCAAILRGVFAASPARIVVAGSLLTLQSLLIIGLLLERRRKKAAERELNDLTRRLFSIQDEERRRIARELHDGTAQNLFAISTNVAKLSQIDSLGESSVAQLVSECQSLADESLKEIRTLSYLLHPPLLDQAGLVSALQWYVEGFSRRSGIDVRLDTEPTGRLPSDIEMALFRVVQESLTNIHRHSTSETASIRLQNRRSEIRLEIKDQGRGLLPVKHDPESNGHMSLGVGIPGMTQRLRQLGGNLEIASNGHGTTISAVVPVENGANHGANTSS